jgi:hypothetical protein
LKFKKDRFSEETFSATDLSLGIIVRVNILHFYTVPTTASETCILSPVSNTKMSSFRCSVFPSVSPLTVPYLYFMVILSILRYLGAFSLFFIARVLFLFTINFFCTTTSADFLIFFAIYCKDNCCSYCLKILTTSFHPLHMYPDIYWNFPRSVDEAGWDNIIDHTSESSVSSWWASCLSRGKSASSRCSPTPEQFGKLSSFIWGPHTGVK